MISPDRMYQLALEEVQEEYEKLYAECEELKTYIKSHEKIGDDCEFCKHNDKENCHMNIILDDLKTITRYKQALDVIEKIINSLHYQTLIFHSGNTHVLADKIQETKNQIQGIINTAKEVNNAG